MERRGCGDRENGDGPRRSPRSPILGFRRSCYSVFFLSAVDLLEDLLVRRESVCRLVGVDDIIVDRYLEEPATAFLENFRDFVFVLDGRLQTGGLSKAV